MTYEKPEISELGSASVVIQGTKGSQIFDVGDMTELHNKAEEVAD